jgi:hypothetical protein
MANKDEVQSEAMDMADETVGQSRPNSRSGSGVNRAGAGATWYVEKGCSLVFGNFVNCYHSCECFLVVFTFLLLTCMYLLACLSF